MALFGVWAMSLPLQLLGAAVSGYVHAQTGDARASSLPGRAFLFSVVVVLLLTALIMFFLMVMA